jgi:[ribosomal protein S5]-alanine N-acetyltransferase
MIKLLKKNSDKKRKNIQHNFSIIYNNKLIGGIGVKIDQIRPHIAEIGYFIDRNYQNKVWLQNLLNFL